MRRRVTWLGHATVLIETRRRAPAHRPGAARPRHAPHAPRPDAGAPRPTLDAVLISHLHHDHLDKPSLRGLRARPRSRPSAPRSTCPGYDGARGPARATPSTSGVDRRGRPRLARRPPPPRARRRGARHARLPHRRHLVRRRHRPRPGDGGAARPRRRRADPDLGLGPVTRARAPGPRRRRAGDRADRAADRRAHPLGHVPAARRSAGATTRLLDRPPAGVRGRRAPARVETIASGGSLDP